MIVASGSSGSRLRRLLWLGDVLLVATAILASYASHGWLRVVVPELRAPAPRADLLLLALLFIPCWVTLVAIAGLDRVLERLSRPIEIVGAVGRATLGGIIVVALLTFLSQAEANRSLVALTLTYAATFTLVERLALAAWTRRGQERGVARRRVLVLGDAGDTLDYYLKICRAMPLSPQIVGRLGSNALDASRAATRNVPEPQSHIGPNPGASVPPPHLGPVDALAHVLHHEAVDDVVFLPPFSDPTTQSEMLQHCEELGLTAYFALRVPAVGNYPPRLQEFGGEPFLAYGMPPKSLELLALKQLGDTVVALLLLLALVPLLVLVALAIRISMGTPILFRQQRVGLNGRRFFMWKFRTMVADAERRKSELLPQNESRGPTFKLTGDPRITPLGHLLRRSSIDELPQLWNVLTGAMSLVGPRPLPVDEQQRIRGAARRRLAMRPGITGLWQVSGRSNVEFDDWMRLDLRYVDRWSPVLDLWILARTIPAVIRGRGAR